MRHYLPLTRAFGAVLTVLAILWVGAPAAAQHGDTGGETPTATLTLSFTNNGLPLDENEHGKFYIHEVDERGAYLDWGHAGRTARVPEGEYDLVIKYENGEISETITRKKIELKGDTEETIDFRVPVAHLRVEITRGGEAIEPFTGSYSVYRSGRRDSPLVRKRPGTEITIRPGTYDIEVAHRGPEGMKTRWVEGVLVNGFAQQSVELGLPRARLAQATVTLVEEGRRIRPESGVWRVYAAGQRESPLAERRSGEILSIEKGVYDIGAFYSVDGTTRERWMNGVDFGDDVERQIEMGVPAATLRVNVNNRARLLRNAWFSVYQAGQRDSPIVSARSGGEVELEPGSYDIGCFLRDGGARADLWLRDRSIREPVTLDTELELEEAFLTVLPRERSWRRDKSGDPRILFLVDSSDRMASPLRAGNRLSVALPALADGLADLPAGVEVGLRSVGGEADSARECRATSLRVPAHVPDAGALAEALARLRPAGAAPLALALAQVAEDLPPGPENVLVLVTSGADGCGGDLCSAVSSLLLSGSVGRIFAVGFDLDRDQMRRLDCVGEQRFARDAAELSAAVREIVREATSSDDGTVSVFRAGRPTEWVAGGAVGEKIRLNAGTYDIQIHARGRTYEWEGAELRGDIEAPVGRRLRSP